ncbi:MAG: BCSC C-terminal domain-containing protein [Desulfamplus sp.]|nr:BCSC C-terminal domain-containing protein [Desulfamplus sp.]
MKQPCPSNKCESANDESARDKSVKCKSANDEPARDKSVKCKSANDEPARDKSVKCKSANDEPARDKSAKYKSVGKKYAVCLILSIFFHISFFNVHCPAMETTDNLHGGMAWDAYNAGEYARAENLFMVLLEKEPHSMNLVTGLGYSLYKQGKYEQLHGIIQGDRIRNTPEIIELKKNFYSGWLNHLGTQGKPEKAWDLAMLLSDSGGGPEMDAAENYYADTGRMRAASWLFTNRKTRDTPCYLNAWSPEYGLLLHHDIRDGDRGTSFLRDRSAVAYYRESLSFDREWSFSLKRRDISTGDGTVSDENDMDASYSAATGSAYRRLNPGNGSLSGTLHGDETVYEGWLTFNKEGPMPVEISLGTSPIGGKLDGTPTFNVWVRRGKLDLEIHRQTVEDSMLSLSGLKDPHGEKVWGGVVKNGFTIRGSLSMGDAWLSLTGGYDAYRGVNVWQNSSVNLNGALGKNFKTSHGSDVILGVYLTGLHFENNSNFFTFGHGGYYSPGVMMVAGPIFRYKSPPCREYRLDIQASMGWMFEKTEDSPRYPIHYEIVDDFTRDALQELQGFYPGKRTESLTGSVKLEGWKMLSRKLSAGIFANFDSGSDYMRWSLGLGVEYALKPRTGFWQTER